MSFLFGGMPGYILGKLFDDAETETKTLERGDVIGVSRGLYDHYGVYVNKGTVIHYTSSSGDISSNNKIMKTSFKKFLRGATDYFILDFPECHEKPSKIKMHTYNYVLPMSIGYFDILLSWLRKNRDYTLYSADETIERAMNRLGEDEYSLVLNNCEHFAIWCKTGISESHQINEFIEKILNPRKLEGPKF